MTQGIIIGILIVAIIFNFLYTYLIMNYVVKLHKMLNAVFQAISGNFTDIEKQLKSVIKLKPGEKFAATTLYFKGLDISKANGEPMDSITVLEYSNTPTEARVNE